MCGLWGAVRADNARFKNIDDFMSQGLYCSALRGTHGTGVGLVESDFTHLMVKSHLPAASFIHQEEYDWIAKKMIQNPRVLLGHTRSATYGSVATKNAHPFKAEDEKKGESILMIHNGTIGNYLTLTPAGFSHQVDSAHVCHSLMEHGALETLQRINGAYVLIWYDLKRKTFNIARNQARELWISWNKDKTAGYFGSELDMLCSVLERTGQEYSRNLDEVGKEIWYEWDLSKKSLEEPKMTPYEKKQWPVYPKSSGSNWSGGQSYPASSGTRSFTQSIDYSRQARDVRKNDSIRADVLVEDIDDFRSYPESHGYGWVWGTRNADNGSLVKITGISKAEWDKRWSHIHHYLPCIVSEVKLGLCDPSSSKLFNFYQVYLDKAEAKRQLYDHLRNNNQLSVLAELLDEDRTEEESRGSLPRLTHNPGISSKDGKQVAGTSPTVGPVGEETRGSDAVGPLSGASRVGESSGLGVEEKPKPIYVPGPLNREISLQSWKDIAMWGCAICNGGKIALLDVGKVGFIQQSLNPEDHPADAEWQMICPECHADPLQMEKVAAA